MDISSQSADQQGLDLAPWETSMIELFVRAASLIGLPKSVGEIYGLLYCATEPVGFDELQVRLGISRGSVSQGLKLLRQLGAVKAQYIAGNRKDHYVPELSMKRLVGGFVRDQFTPHLVSGKDRMDSIRELVDCEPDETLREHAAQRLNTLTSWQKRVQRLLPIVMAALSGVQILEGRPKERDLIL